MALPSANKILPCITDHQSSYAAGIPHEQEQ